MKRTTKMSLGGFAALMLFAVAIAIVTQPVNKKATVKAAETNGPTSVSVSLTATLK